MAALALSIFCDVLAIEQITDCTRVVFVEIEVDRCVALSALRFARAVTAETGGVAISAEHLGAISPNLGFSAISTRQISDILVQTTPAGDTSCRVETLQTVDRA